MFLSFPFLKKKYESPRLCHKSYKSEKIFLDKARATHQELKIIMIIYPPSEEPRIVNNERNNISAMIVSVDYW